MPNATRLLLVRHGATQLTAEDRFSGSVGVDLSDEGRGRSSASPGGSRDDSIAAIYASPLARTVETAADSSARPHDLTPV